MSLLMSKKERQWFSEAFLPMMGLLERLYIVEFECYGFLIVELKIHKARPQAGSGDIRRRWDSNPRRLFTLHDFQSCSLGHYETPPEGVGGESGIRTHEGLHPTAFRERHIRPL